MPIHTIQPLMKRRAVLSLMIIFLVIMGLWGRLIYVQLIRTDYYQGKALDQRLRPIPVDGHRGSILDRNGIAFARSVSADAVYSIPVEVRDPEGSAVLIAQVLDLSVDFVYDRLTRRASSHWLKKQITPEETQALRDLNLPGIGIIENPRRIYEGGLAAQVIGISGIDNQGLEGLEVYYDHLLRGKTGAVMVERDAAGREIPHGIHAYVPPVDGYDLVLTIDSILQQVAEKELEKIVLETGAVRGTVLMMDPWTGEILISATYPSFDPNHFSDYPAENRRNMPVTDMYEPGSTFKVITGAAALQQGIATPHSTYHDPGFIRVSGWTVRCHRRGGHGSVTFAESLEVSCNVAFATMAIDLGDKIFYDHIRNFGFGQLTGIDFPGESLGKLRAPSKDIPLVTWSNIGFGQGLSVTPLQLATGLSAIVNGGNLVQPHLVKAIQSKDGEVVQEITPQPKRRVMDQEHAFALRGMLEAVVAEGSGKRAAVEGYSVGGKTGTAQMIENGRYSHTKVMTSFIGFAPVEDPKFVMLVAVQEPKTLGFGGLVAAPVFAKIAEAALPYLGVERKPEQLRPNPWGGAPLRVALEETIVPEVRSLSTAEARKRLSDLSLHPLVLGNGRSVIDQIPRPGSSVLDGTTILLYTEIEEEAAVEAVSTGLHP